VTATATVRERGVVDGRDGNGREGGGRDADGAAVPGRLPIREVVRGDGGREGFDPARLARSIHRAAVAVGQGELLLAEELAALVALVLEEEHGAVAPATRVVRETTERVLMETGHHDVARSYILLHAAPATAAPGATARDGSRDAPLRVASPGRECIEPFDAAKIATALLVDGGLKRAEAAAIAAAVERQARAFGREVVSAATVRQLVAAELLARGCTDRLAGEQGLGLPAAEVEAIAFQRGMALEPAPLRLGGELLRRFALARLLEPVVAQAHLNGDLHVDGLAAPGQALAATLDLSQVRRASWPGALAGLLHLVHGLEAALHGPLELWHVERALAPAFADDARAGDAARTLLLALADAPSPRSHAEPPRRVLGVGADLPTDVAESLFRRGGAPAAVRERLHAFVVELLEQAVAAAPHLRVPRVRVLVDPGDEERELLQLAAPLQPALALGAADVAHSAQSGSTVRVVGARVALNIARLGLAAGRRRESALLDALPELVERGLSAGANQLRVLLQRDEQGVGFLRRLRELLREIARDLPLELPGSHAYALVLVPVGIDAAIRAVTERDPDECQDAARLRTELLARLAAALPANAAAGTRFELREAAFPEAEQRFGRADFLRFPRGRDVLGLAHDGAAFRYAFDPLPHGQAMAAAVAGPSVRVPRPTPHPAARTGSARPGAGAPHS